MHSDTVTIYCPNHLCQAPNPEGHRFCQQCRTHLPKRYLWAVGKGINAYRSGELLAGRYSVKQNGIVLDTQPGQLPNPPAEISPELEPYLRLVPYQPHVPQVYGLVSSASQQGDDILLLEQAPLYTEGVIGAALELLEGQLMPALTTVWAQSSAMRQLNWLWQLAHLWEPLATEGVAATLLQPDLLRVEEALVRLLSLQADGRTAITLAALGRLWQQWLPTAQPAIASFLGELCQLLQQGHIRNGEQLVALLDRALAACGRSQSRQIHIATVTDQGPSRQRNEDACYPPGGTVWDSAEPGQNHSPAQPLAQPLVIVCDGIGGHEGGSVASNLAIATMQQQLQTLPPQDKAIEPTVLMLQLEQATLTANDVISQRNDYEQRQERQRMGTTLVLALAYAHELYLTHVGDSRIYRMTRLGCHQVTLDDDLAAREVRLGYALYREALQQPGSGSLVQALGMGASTLLHPTVQRFVLDEDCVFLLCSDGLSDHDRVDEYWQSELLPLLEGKTDVATASQRLLAIANSKNGHDNVTIGLLHCRVSPQMPSSNDPLKIALDIPDIGITPTVALADHFPTARTQASTKTQILPTRQAVTHPAVRLFALLLVLGLSGLLAAYALLPDVRLWAASLLGTEPSPLSEASVVPSTPTPTEPSPATSTELSVGSFLQVGQAPVETPPVDEKPLILWSQPDVPTLPKTARVRLGIIPAGSVLQLTSRQAIADRGYWLKLKVCSVPTLASPTSASPQVNPKASPKASSKASSKASPKTNSKTSPKANSKASPQAPTAIAILQRGEIGWIEQDTIAPLVTQNLGLKASELGACAIPPPDAPATPATSAPAKAPVPPTKAPK